MQLEFIDKEIVLVTLIMAFVLKIVVFILGFYIVKMGFALIRDGVKGSFKFSADAKGINGALQSSSPGLLFVLLGTVLIGYAIFLKKGVDVSDTFSDSPATMDRTEAKRREANENNGHGIPNLGSIDTTMTKP